MSNFRKFTFFLITCIRTWKISFLPYSEILKSPSFSFFPNSLEVRLTYLREVHIEGLFIHIKLFSILYHLSKTHMVLVENSSWQKIILMNTFLKYVYKSFSKQFKWLLINDRAILSKFTIMFLKIKLSALSAENCPRKKNVHNVRAHFQNCPKCPRREMSTDCLGKFLFYNSLTFLIL